MKLLIELVRKTTTSDEWSLDLLVAPTGHAFEDALVAMAKAVEGKLTTTVADHPRASDPYADKIEKFDTTLRSTYKAHTATEYNVKYSLASDGASASATLRFEAKEGSIYIEKLKDWFPITGAIYSLALESDTSSEKDLIGAHTYYLQIRAEDEVGACTYEISTDPLSALPAGQARKAALEGRIKGVTLFFSHTRSVILGVDRVQDVQPLRGHVGSPGFHDDKNVWILPKTPSLTPDGMFVRVRVRFIGDPAHIRAATLLTDPGEAVAPATWSPDKCAPFPSPPAILDMGDAAGLVDYGATWEMEMDRRLCLLRRIPGDISPHIFFYELDKKSTNNLDFAALGGFLTYAYLARARIFDESGVSSLSLSHTDLEELGPSLPKAGGLVLDLMRKHLGIRGDIDFPAVDDAFMRFARGELTIFDTHGAPNGVNMFAFAELARMSMTLGREKGTWRRLFDIFSRACEVFVRSYHTLGSRARTICSYRVENNSLGRRGPTAVEKVELRTRWDHDYPMDTEESYSRLVHGALFDETMKEQDDRMDLPDHVPMVIP